MLRNTQPILDTGGDGAVIVLLHGFLASKNYWKQLQPELVAAGYRVISIDLLGFGAAPKPKHIRYSYDDHIAHIYHTIAGCNLREPFTLVGHSMGALLAARYSSRYPDSVSELALINPPIYRDRAQVRSTLRDTGWLYRLFLDSRFRHFLWIFIRTFGPFGPHTKHSREGSLANVIEATEMFADLDTSHHRTLLLVGTKDRKEYLENLASASLNETITVLHETVDHHAPRNNPALVSKRLVAFLSGD